MIELGFHFLAEFWLVTLIDEPVPEFVHESDAIPDRPGIDFREDRIEIHAPTSRETKSACAGFECDGSRVPTIIITGAFKKTQINQP
jgi:hypothetical protein